MSSAWFAVLLVSVTASEPPQFAPILHLPFDGAAGAAVPPAGVTVAGADGLLFAEGKVGRAADFTEKGCIELRGLPRLDLTSGTLEFWVKSAHGPRELQDHYYLQFLRNDGTGGIELKFYQVECSVQAILWRDKSRNRRYGWGWAKDTWQQVVVTWETTDPDTSGLGLYKNGVETGYPRPYRLIGQPDFLRVGCKSLEEGLHAKALIDEVCVYNRCLTREQVKTLYANGGKPMAEKLAAVRARIAADDARRARRKDLLFNHRRLAMLHGRYTSLVHWKDAAFTPLRIPVPDKVHETQLATTDLSRYDAVIVPGGGGLRLDDANKQALHDYIRAGGGYVGICGGAVTAARYGLIEAKRYGFGVRGKVWTHLKAHPITEGYDIKRNLLFPHASGPLFVIGEKSPEQPIVTFQVGNPPLPTFVNTIARPFGKGRVVVFSGHPESSTETRRLLRNAVMWAARVTDAEVGQSQPTDGGGK